MAKNLNMRGILAARVVDRIKQGMANGSLIPGQYIPSERILAKELGVSRVTVRRGLDQLVRSAVLKREACKGYTLRDSSRESSAPGLRTAVVFVHSHSEESLVSGTRHARIWAGAKEEATKAGLLTMIMSVREEEMTPARAAEIAKVAAGVLCDHPGAHYLRTLQEAGIPLVQIDYHRLAGLAVDAVVQDDAGGIGLAVEYLHAHGHRRIGYLDTTPQYQAAGRGLNAEQRLAGFKAATAGLGIGADCAISTLTGEAAEAVCSLIGKGITALVLPHIDFWPEIRDELVRAGIVLPCDFGLVAWGLDPKPGETGPWPSSVTWSREQMGREAVRRLLLRMRGERVEPATILIPCELIDRGTGGRGPEVSREAAAAGLLAQRAVSVG